MHTAGETDLLVVAVIDLDHFKEVNDQFGHATGDMVLKSSVEAWRSVLRASDSLARLGGDEFITVLRGCDRSDAMAIFERLRAGTHPLVTCSMGAASRTPGETSDAPGAGRQRAV